MKPKKKKKGTGKVQGFAMLYGLTPEDREAIGYIDIK